MSSNPNHAATLKTALEELRQRRSEIEALRASKNGPIAIIGMSCRFPGGCNSPESFWQLLDKGVCAIGEVPAERWDATSMPVRRGGFIEGIEDFDAPFFGISPREAGSMDPQQRLLLEVAWQALANAKLPPGSLYERPVGTFLGITCFDHGVLLGADPEQAGAYAGTGSALNAAAGRLSFLLGLTGPCMAIDTACSSSLVCLHLACQSLRSAESEIALVGGVHLMLSPGVMITFSQAHMLSPDGLSKSFDASADGYSRGEGCGVVVLKRLTDAVRDRDNILGIVRGTAVGHSGPSGGLTVPSAAAQRSVIQRALADAGLEPHQVGYVEAHGTGTSLGDPIEIEAMARAYGRGRDREAALWTGSVKTNIGHLEPASGIAGLIKILLAFQNGRIPASLNFRDPNPHIPWNEIPIRVAAAPVEWKRGGVRRIAGLSAFGFSGTNAHAIVEEPPETHEAAPTKKTPGLSFQRQHYPLAGKRNAKASPPEWFYRVDWEQAPAVPTAAGGETWLIVRDRRGLAENLTKLAESQTIRCVLGNGVESLDEGSFDRIVFMKGLDDPSCAPLLLGIAQAAARRAEKPPRIWLITRGATEAAVAPELDGIAQAPLSGLAKVLFLEHPELAGAAIDLETASAPGETESLFREIVSGSAEDLVAFRGGKRLVPRLAKAEPGSAAEVKIAPGHAYMITGGFGALGLRVAGWLADRGARQLILVGRAGPRTGQARTAIAALEARQIGVRCECADVADRAQMDILFRSCGPALGGVIHAAGVAGYRAFDEIGPDHWDAVLRPKVQGAEVLHELTRSLELDFFVCFSSIASVWGSRGQAHYAAANRYLDALAHHRRAHGLPALTINWGPWAEGGMNTAESNALLLRAGVNPLATDKALAALGRLLGSGETQAIVADVDWPLFRGSYEARGHRPLLARMDRGKAAHAAGTPSLPRSRDELIRFIQHETAQVLEFRDTLPDPDRGFFDVGMDSLLALEFRTRLETCAGRALPATLIFDNPTIEAVADYLLGSARGEAAVAPAANNEAIAIIGFGCRFPGDAVDGESYWRVLRDGIDAISEVPRERWSLDEHYSSNPDDPGKMYTRHGGFLRDVDLFDPAFFRVSPREAESMDPQHRLLLEVSWEALENAGLRAEDLKGSQTGVYVGITTHDYAHLLMQNGGNNGVDSYFFTGNPLNTAAGRVSYTFGLTGPAIALDTACSSSLVAIHQACQALRSGECAMALAGGVNLTLAPETTVAVCRTHALSPDGRCRSFDESANGFVRSEGCGVVVLKTESRALADGDSILAVIRGSAVNHDGASSGFTVPNGHAQEAVLRKALGGIIAPSQVDYIEAHGSGTQLGDPIEVRALAEVFGNGGGRSGKLRIGSVKSNIGHTESAAGVAGVIKVLLALQHELLPPSLHVHNPNPLISWNEMPLEICRERVPWQRGERKRIAGVSAFGASGTNAHVVIEEAPQVALPGQPGRRAPLPHRPFHRVRIWFKEGPKTVQTPEKHEEAIAGPRRESILLRLKAIVAEFFYADAAAVDDTTPFLEMGADSLVLMDVMQSIEREYGVKLAVRNFFEDLSTLAALADHIDRSLLAKAPPPVSEPLSADAPSVIERVIAEQNRMVQQVIAQQMEMLRQMKVPPGYVPPPAPPTPPVAATPEAPERAAPLLPWGAPVSQGTQGLSPVQRKHLEELTDRYTKRTRRSREMVQESRAVLADSRATVGFRFSTKEMLYPIVGVRAQGSKLWDVDGNEYVDFTMGFGVHLFGHQPDFINKAIEDEFRRGVELGARSDLVGEVATLFTRLTGHERVAFSNTGTEAVMAAMRLARAATGRTKIVIFTHSYHGHSDGTLAAARIQGGKAATVAIAPGVPAGAVEDIAVLEYATEGALQAVRELGGELAAVMVEPVQSRNPSLQPGDFLRELRRITKKCGAALIFDEMITGLRVHPKGAQGWFDIEADLATYGKVAGGGLPIGVVAGKARFMDGIDGGMWQYGDASFPAAERTAFGGTFCQHPLSMAAARAVLRHLLDDKGATQDRLNKRTAEFAEQLNRTFEDGNVPIRVAHFGSMFRFEFSSNLDLFFYHLLEKGIYIWEWRTCFLSTAHTEEDLRKFAAAIDRTIAELRRGGWLSEARVDAAVRIPLSEAQRQLWLLSQIERGGNLAYHVNTSVELVGELDRGRLQRAIQKVMERHEALRTVIASDQEQIVQPASKFKFVFEDDPDSGEAMDLREGPLFRANLVRRENGRHILSLTAHHIISDGASMALLVGEIADFYSGRNVAARPMQFREYLGAAASRMKSPEMQAHRDYWLSQIGADSPSVQLPLDRARPALSTHRGGRITWRIDSALTDGLRRLARSQGCTLFASLTAVFNVLLHRITGQDDLTVGLPVTGRFSRESQSVAGYCTHLLPVRSRFAADVSFRQFLLQSRQTLFDGIEHQDYPFAELLRELGPRRGAGASPLISVVFNLEPVSRFAEIPGLTLEPAEPEVRFVAFDLSVNVTDAGSELHIDCDYSSDVLEPKTVRRFLEIYETLLRAGVADPDARVSQMPLLSESAMTALVAMWNGPVLPGSFESALSLFEEQAARNPERNAVVDRERRVSYGQLNDRASRIAGELVKRGVGKDTRVGVCAGRTADLIAGLLAVWKAGGAYVPLDPEYPTARLEAMLHDAGIEVMLTDRACAPVLLKYSAGLVFVDGECLPVEAAPTAVEPQDLAYVIYTSGSTGKPKGVAITQASLGGLVDWARSFYTPGQLQGVLFSTSVCFDVSVFEIFVPLACGGTVVIAENVLDLPRLPSANEVTLISTVPSAVPELLRSGPLPASVSTFQLAGERLFRSVVQRIYRQTEVRQVLNIYGPTEDTVYSTAAIVERDDEWAPSIGRPLLNKRVRILDRHLQPVPPGIAGELYLGGPGLAREYLNRPELTRERFVADPYREGERLYRTGDLVRFREDGNIEFLGRGDTQIKLRGFRIELGEIESALTLHPLVRDAIVVMRGEDERALLIAYVASDHSEEDVRAALGRHLQDRLPHYMMPAQFAVLKEFPLLPNGKMDRARLPEPGVGALYTAPRDAMEEKVAAIWQEALGKSGIGVFDNFFEMGGNSLSATRVAVRIREEMTSDLKIRGIFAHPTIAGLAREIARRGHSHYEPILPTPWQESYDLAPFQMRLWVQEQTGQAQGAMLPACFLIEGNPDEDLFDEAFRALIRRHEILRTVFPAGEHLPRQRVLSPDEFRFAAARFDASGAGDPEAEAVRILQQDASSPMDPATGPLLRMTLIRLGGMRHLCACAMHHMVTDGVSIEVLIDEFQQAYDALADGRAPNFEPLPIQYKDYAAWLNQLLGGERGADMQTYWLRKLAGELLPLDFPSDVPRPVARGYRRQSYRFQLGADRARQVEAIGRRHGASQFMVMLAVLKALLYRSTGSDDIIVGSPLAGRVRTELQNQIGPYLNVVALRTPVAGADPFDTLLDRVRETTLEAHANQLYPLDRIVEQLGVKRSFGRNPLFDVGFTLQNQRLTRRENGSRRLRISEKVFPELETTAAEAMTDFWILAEPAGDVINMNVVYNGSLFQESTVRRLAAGFHTILGCAANDGGVRLHSIPLDPVQRPQTVKVAIDLAFQSKSKGKTP